MSVNGIVNPDKKGYSFRLVNLYLAICGTRDVIPTWNGLREFAAGIQDGTKRMAS